MPGYAELPLHSGHVPPHLLRYMKKLARAIAMFIVEEFGPDELVRRLADPLWFQAFNNIIGMDWDSSGSTTVVLYVLKNFANTSSFRDVGFAVLGGKGDDARRLPEELKHLSNYLDSPLFERISRLSARIDSVLLQDGYSLYIHGLVVSESGTWTVVQQGMNVEVKLARRYHLHGARNVLPSTEEDPHAGVACNHRHRALNLVDRLSSEARRTILDLATSDPRKILGEIMVVNRVLRGVKGLDSWFPKTRGSAQVSSLVRDPVARVDPAVNPRFYRPV
ncbi:MAG: DUF763 domain-containing protein, partial [Thermoprotei archaeon]